MTLTFPSLGGIVRFNLVHCRLQQATEYSFSLTFNMILCVTDPDGIVNLQPISLDDIVQ